MRATPDVSLDADPASGVSVYDSVRYQGQSGWFTVGGTSASSPMWAGRSAVQAKTVDSAYVYGTSIGFRDITSGNNGASCLVGFDLCSGLGSWNDGGSTTPPPPTLTPPTNLVATPRGKRISVTWQDDGSAAGYRLYRGASGSEAFYSDVAGTSFNDSGVVSGTTYCYEVTAVGSDGAESAPSNEGCATAR